MKTKFNAGMKSSVRGDWKTPLWLLAYLKVGEKLFDVSSRKNGFDAMNNPWPTPWFCNPPYGSEIGNWTLLMPLKGPGIALLPARTDTRWFHRDVLPYAKIQFVYGQLHFDEVKTCAPFPSLLAFFECEKLKVPYSPSLVRP